MLLFSNKHQCSLKLYKRLTRCEHSHKERKCNSRTFNFCPLSHHRKKNCLQSFTLILSHQSLKNIVTVVSCSLVAFSPNFKMTHSPFRWDKIQLSFFPTEKKKQKSWLLVCHFHLQISWHVVNRCQILAETCQWVIQHIYTKRQVISFSWTALHVDSEKSCSYLQGLLYKLLQLGDAFAARSMTWKDFNHLTALFTTH